MPLPWRSSAPNPKLTLPAPGAAALPRPRLEQQLLSAPHALWVGSPAASGKTVLVASAVRSSQRPCCWYQVDRADSDPGTFFHFLAQAGADLGPRRRAPLPSYGREVGEQLHDFARAWCRAWMAWLSLPSSATLAVLALSLLGLARRSAARRARSSWPWRLAGACVLMPLAGAQAQDPEEPDLHGEQLMIHQLVK